MKQAYVTKRFSAENRGLIDLINSIINNFLAQGFTLSVRQLYYQLVARDLISNTEQSYKRIAGLINDGRLAGLIDWDAIEDRNRDIEVRSRWTSGSSIVSAVADQYHMDMWVGQDERVFIIVEKAALAGVLGGISKEYDVPLLAARGYPSVSIVRELVMEHFKRPLQQGQDIKVLHFGDHDPSGLDMTRDLTERIDLFVDAEVTTGSIQVVRLALNMPQVQELRPPPNPAKVTDSRFEAYQREHGDESWELDALTPSYLVGLARQNITRGIDEDIWAQREDEIQRVKHKLQDIADNFED